MKNNKIEEDSSDLVFNIGGTGFSGILTIIFIILKLFNVIKWSWFWVLSPIWIPAAIVTLATVIILIVILLRK